MGRRRFQEDVPVSEIVYALLLTKWHLRRYIRDHGLVDFAGDRMMPDELLPLELHSIQELELPGRESSSIARSITWRAATRRKPRSPAG